MPYVNSSRVTHYQAKAVIWVVIDLGFLQNLTDRQSRVKSQESRVKSQESRVKSDLSPCPPCPLVPLVSLSPLSLYSPCIDSGADSVVCCSISGAAASNSDDSASS